ncbi:hypothetical protein G6F56_002953 [Rhizopus delemar]|nr:hypothetical protein G6F56_002953 [Rhizopus delemar]
MEQWQPDQQRLRELAIMLRNAANPNAQDQGLLNQRLELLNENPYYNAYLIHILIKSTDQDINMRLVAGKQLEKNIKNNMHLISTSALNYIKQACIKALTYPDSLVSQVVSSVMALIVIKGRVFHWIEALYFLTYQLDSLDSLSVETALDTLVTICKEAARELDEEIQEIRPMNFILLKLVKIVTNPRSSWRAKAIDGIRQFIPLPSFDNHITTILPVLYARTIDTDTHVRQELGRTFSILWQMYPKQLKPYLHPTIEYMIQITEDPNETVALCACDFWIEYAHADLYHHDLVPYLPRLVQCLLKIMVYSESDLSELSRKGDIYDTGPSLEYSPKDLMRGPEEPESDELQNTTDDEEYDDELNDFDDEEFYSQISLRESSAGTLEALSIAFEKDFASALLDQLLNKTLCDQNWLVRESGILALGAAAEGGIEVISNYLRHLIPYLLHTLQDPQPLIRATSCWVISRFSKWLVVQYDTSKEGREHYFEPVLSALLNRILDTNKQVQLSACTAITIMEENASYRIVSYIYSILIQTNRAFAFYHRKNRLILYDTLGTLADSAKEALNNQTYIRLLMPPLITKWNELADNDTDLYPLLELQIRAEEYMDMSDTPNVQVLIAALDLLSGIVRGLGPSIRPLLSKTSPPLLPLLATCIHYPLSDVLQSTFMLIGDITMDCFDLLEPFVPDILDSLTCAIQNPELTLVYNNALWAIGEIVMRWKSNTSQHVPTLVDRTTSLLDHDEEKIRENAMSALGRLGLTWPKQVAPYLPQFVKSWLNKSMSVREGDEKDSAFRGLCAMIELNPRGVQKQELYLLLVAISSWKSPSPLLLKDLHKTTCKTEWEHAFSSLDKEAKIAIQNLLE